MSTRLTPLILFVRKFDACLTFYTKAFGLKPHRVYRGPGHPDWAEFRLPGARLCLHGRYRGPRFRSGIPLAVHFEVRDLQETIRRIRRYGGRVRRPPQRYDFRPAELQEVLATSFSDPDGNVFEVQQVLRRFRG